MKVLTKSSEETKELGQRLAPLLEPGDIIILIGNLGAGKTVFVSGLAKGLEVEGQVSSPSFVLIKEYPGRLNLYHIDAYRLEGPALAELGLEEYFYSDGVSVVEWGEKVSGLLPEAYLEIRFRCLDEPSSRQIEIWPTGERWESRVKEWLK
ncbi:MAG: tRNA (adenosine(37)-N6)-threonylcarbamoyltransferase complex ATPase subunit type 1 TsaE [Actinobacteria bacterium]|nr:MAG: tRNA (adenosine(37)-N6)-threonylcarbamoyltransferase complex ATPase subunit type 1 TsaE [Actinomycetota bacterium]